MRGAKYIAAPADGKDILRILESSAAQGGIELVYTRREDAYASYLKEPGEAKVFVSKDGDRTVGTCAELIRDVYIGGERRKAAYVCGLKKDAAYDGLVGFGPGFIKALQRDDVDFYYCSVVADNAEAQTMFAKGGRALSMEPVAEYKTYIFSPKVPIKAPKHEYTFRQAREDDLPALLEFLNTEGKKKDLFPVIDSLDSFHNLAYHSFYLLLDGETIVACGALWNQVSYKQYIVKKYRGLMKLARFANPLLSALGYIRLPKENEPLDITMLAFFLSKDDNERYYRIFLKEIRSEIAKNHSIFVLGLPKNHFAAPFLNKLPNISFETKLYEITFPWSGQAYSPVNPDAMHPECGLL